MEADLALIGLGTGMAVLGTAVVTLILSVKNRRKVEQVHVLVNSKMKMMVSRVEQLVEALEESDTAVPPEPKQEIESGDDA